ncbi:MAG: hypothetical protein WDW38_003330 [Sanguina aurantia]
MLPQAHGDRLSLQSVIQAGDDFSREAQQQHTDPTFQQQLSPDQAWGLQASRQAALPDFPQQHQQTFHASVPNQGARYAQLRGSSLQPSSFPQQQQQQSVGAYAQLQMQQTRSVSHSQAPVLSEGQLSVGSSGWQQQDASFDMTPLMRSHPEGQWHGQQLGQGSGPHIVRMAAPAPRVPTGRHIDMRNNTGGIGMLQLPHVYGMRPAAGSDVFTAVSQAPVVGGGAGMGQYGRPQGHRPVKLGTVATYNPATGIRSSEPIGSQVTMISSTGMMGPSGRGSATSSPATSSCQVASPFGGLSQAQVQLQLAQQQQQHLQVQQRQQTVSSIGLQQMQAGQMRGIIHQQQKSNSQLHIQSGIQLQRLQQSQLLYQQQQYHGGYAAQQAELQQSGLGHANSSASSSSVSIDGQPSSFNSGILDSRPHVHNASWSDLQNAHSVARTMVQTAQQQHGSTPPSIQQQLLWQMQGSVPGPPKPQSMHGPPTLMLKGAGSRNGALIGDMNLGPRSSHHSAPQLQLPSAAARLISRSNMRGAMLPPGVAMFSPSVCSVNGWSETEYTASAESSASQASEVQQLLRSMYPAASHQQLLAILSQQSLGTTYEDPNTQQDAETQENAMRQQQRMAMPSRETSRPGHGLDSSADDIGPLGAFAETSFEAAARAQYQSGSASQALYSPAMATSQQHSSNASLGSLLDAGATAPALHAAEISEQHSLPFPAPVSSSFNSVLSGGNRSGGGWPAQNPYAGTLVANAATAHSAAGGGGGQRLSGSGREKDADLELEVLLSCIGSELARNGISVHDAAAAGWLGDLTTDSVSTLVASFRNEQQRLGNGDVPQVQPPAVPSLLAAELGSSREAPTGTAPAPALSPATASSWHVVSHDVAPDAAEAWPIAASAALPFGASRASGPGTGASNDATTVTASSPGGEARGLRQSQRVAAAPPSSSRFGFAAAPDPACQQGTSEAAAGDAASELAAGAFESLSIGCGSRV